MLREISLEDQPPSGVWRKCPMRSRLLRKLARARIGRVSRMIGVATRSWVVLASLWLTACVSRYRIEPSELSTFNEVRSARSRESDLDQRGDARLHHDPRRRRVRIFSTDRGSLRGGRDSADQESVSSAGANPGGRNRHHRGRGRGRVAPAASVLERSRPSAPAARATLLALEGRPS